MVALEQVEAVVACAGIDSRFSFSTREYLESRVSSLYDSDGLESSIDSSTSPVDFQHTLDRPNATLSHSLSKTNEYSKSPTDKTRAGLRAVPERAEDVLLPRRDDGLREDALLSWAGFRKRR